VTFGVLTPRPLGLVTVYFAIMFAPIELVVSAHLPEPYGVASRYITEILLGIAFLFVVFGNISLRHCWYRAPLDSPLMAFLCISVISSLRHDASLLTLVLGLRPILRYLLLYYLIIGLNITMGEARGILRAGLTMATLVAAIGILQAVVGPPVTRLLLVSETHVGDTMLRTITPPQVHGKFVFSTLGRYDAFGTYMVVWLFLVFFSHQVLCLKRHRRWMLAFWFAIPLILSFSRQSWLALLIGSLVLLIVLRSRIAWHIVASISACLLILLLLAFLLFPEEIAHVDAANVGQVSLVQRLLEVASVDYLRTVAFHGGRLFVLWFVGARILQVAPWLGFGPGRFGTLTAEVLGYDAASQLGMTPGQTYLVNDVNWVTLLGQVGLLGTIAFLLMLLLVLSDACRTWTKAESPEIRGLAASVAALTVAFIVLGFFGPNLEQRVLSMYFWALAGLLVSVSRSQRPARRSRGKSGMEIA